MAMVYSILKWDWNHFTGIVRALLWIIFHPLTILKKRAKFKIIRVSEDKNIFKNLYKKSVVLDYFIKKIKTYSEIDSKAL